MKDDSNVKFQSTKMTHNCRKMGFKLIDIDVNRQCPETDRPRPPKNSSHAAHVCKLGHKDSEQNAVVPQADVQSKRKTREGVENCNLLPQNYCSHDLPPH